MKNIFEELKNRWPSPVVARVSIKEFSGGVLNPKTLANFDCLGTGPKGAFKVGRKTVYPVDSVIEFLKAHTKVPENGQ